MSDGSLEVGSRGNGMSDLSCPASCEGGLGSCELICSKDVGGSISVPSPGIFRFSPHDGSTARGGARGDRGTIGREMLSALTAATMLASGLSEEVILREWSGSQWRCGISWRVRYSISARGICKFNTLQEHGR